MLCTASSLMSTTLQSSVSHSQSAVNSSVHFQPQRYPSQQPIHVPTCHPPPHQHGATVFARQHQSRHPTVRMGLSYVSSTICLVADSHATRPKQIHALSVPCALCEHMQQCPLAEWKPRQELPLLVVLTCTGNLQGGAGANQWGSLTTAPWPCHHTGATGENAARRGLRVHCGAWQAAERAKAGSGPRPCAR